MPPHIQIASPLMHKQTFAESKRISMIQHPYIPVILRTFPPPYIIESDVALAISLVRRLIWHDMAMLLLWVPATDLARISPWPYVRGPRTNEFCLAIHPSSRPLMLQVWLTICTYCCIVRPVQCLPMGIRVSYPRPSIILSTLMCNGWECNAHFPSQFRFL